MNYFFLVGFLIVFFAALAVDFLGAAFLAVALLAFFTVFFAVVFFAIEDKILRTYNLENVIDAYKHSKIITEFSEELWNTLLDKCVVYEDHIEFIWKK